MKGNITAEQGGRENRTVDDCGNSTQILVLAVIKYYQYLNKYNTRTQYIAQGTRHCMQPYHILCFLSG